jgi:protein-S-isoprenylcysteine O-methyltransferase Ste14
VAVPGWVFRHRGAFCLPPVVFALFWFRGATAALYLSWGLGLSLILAGTALRVWAQQHLHHRLKVPLQLTVSGPYQLVRNPLYLGNTVIYVGATLLSRLPWMVPVTLVWCAGVYALVARYEEAVLLANYGQPYADYCARVPRFFPRQLSGRPLVLRNEFLRSAVRSELHCFLIAIPFLLKEAASRYLLGQ